jgi:hypothetical protein
MSRFCSLLLCGILIVAMASLALAQGTTTATIGGTVTDPQGSAVPAAQITVSNTATNAIFKTETGSDGEWTMPAMAAGSYRVSVGKTGFKTANTENVTLNAGVPVTINLRLELGQTTEVIEVTSGAEIIQATNATVSSTISSREVSELPFSSRNAVELMVNMPGTQTPTNPRSSSINGLPKGALNVTMDGMNVQDNLLKSSDGFFSYIFPSPDALEEVTLTTSAAGVDGTSQGAAQIKFVTKSGSNEFHGGAFWQVRNTFFDANYYYNNQVGLPRDIVKLNQRGFHIGGPILKNKLFFFTNMEYYRLPGTKAYSRTVLTPDSINGNYTYQDPVSKQIRTVNLYAIAAAANQTLPAGAKPYPTTPDAINLATFQQINALTGNGILKSNVPTSNDYERNTLNYSPTGNDSRDFSTSRIDYNIAPKHQISVIYNYNKYDSIPDFLNNIVDAFPGTGTVLGTELNTGQRSNRFAASVGLRSVLSQRITNEFHGGINGGTVLFFDAIGSSALFSQWKGYVPSYAGSLSGVTTTNNSQRRNSPVKEFGDTLSWVRGAHQFAFGGNFDQVSLYQQVVSSSVIPRISFGCVTGDPACTGATSFFTTTNFPNASQSTLNDAAAIWADLVGRVNTITSSVALNENTKKYANTPPVDRDRVREFGLFAQDTWRLKQSFTVTLGIRYERQLPFVNVNNTYTTTGLAGLYGVSGVGNLFKPGTLTGSVPVFNPVSSVDKAYAIPASWDPSVGFAWQIPHAEKGWLSWITGNRPGSMVLRAGYSISTIREGSNVFLQVWGTNPGLTFDTSVSSANTPADFGAAGGVLFRDSAFPTHSAVPSTPTYPLPASFANQIFDFDPNLKIGYVQSWNIGLQREVGKNGVIEARFTGNHGLKEWRLYSLNEVNTVENGFLNEFKVADANLLINRQTSPNSNDFGNKGLPGQGPVPILSTALGTTNDATTATQLINGSAGSAASGIATNAGRMANLTKAGYPANLFVVNPTVAGGGPFILANGGSSFYDAFQLDYRKRMTAGLTVQVNYAFAKSLVNGSSNSAIDNVSYTTLRNGGIDKVPSPFDIHNAIKADWIYELPFGPGRHYFGNVHNMFARKAMEGWQIAGVARLQSGTPLFIQPPSGFGSFNGNSSTSGVVLHNATMADIQSMVNLRKTSSITSAGQAQGVVYYLPQSLIDNTLAAFQQGGKTLANLDPSKPYFGPAPVGQLGFRDYVYIPWQRHWDMSVLKKTKIGERANVEFRAQALNVFNVTNFLADNGGSNSTISSTFGQVSQAYRDISGTVDPGARIIEFVLRVNF